MAAALTLVRPLSEGEQVNSTPPTKVQELGKSGLLGLVACALKEGAITDASAAFITAGLFAQTLPVQERIDHQYRARALMLLAAGRYQWEPESTVADLAGEIGALVRWLAKPTIPAKNLRHGWVLLCAAADAQADLAPGAPQQEINDIEGQTGVAIGLLLGVGPGGV